MALRVVKNDTLFRVEGQDFCDCLIDLDFRIKHILCHFHHQQGVTHYLKNHFEEEQIPPRKKAMKKVLQTSDKRVARNEAIKRRFALLKKIAQKMGIEKWVSYTEKRLPKLLPSASKMPLYKIINDPFSVLFDKDDVKMANFPIEECLVA
jgi:hypothetical protein